MHPPVSEVQKQNVYIAGKLAVLKAVVQQVNSLPEIRLVRMQCLGFGQYQAR